MTVRTRMKKMFSIFWLLICILGLAGCVKRQTDNQMTDSDGIDAIRDGYTEQQNGMQDNIESVVQSSQEPGHTPKMQVLELRNMEYLGLGFMVCVMPDQEEDDYKLYFWEAESDSEDRSKPFSELEFNLDAPDYVFPDVREGNVSIGRFLEIYYFDMTEVQGTDKREWIIIARYDVEGKFYYDTRAYTVSENGYCVDAELIQELNEKYGDAEEYPITELFVMPHD